MGLISSPLRRPSSKAASSLAGGASQLHLDAAH
jgi:hypothetical protein